MKLIIGGAYQGKLVYARNTYQVLDGWIDGSICQMEEIKTCKGIYRFHEYVRRMLEQTEGEYRICTDNLVSLEQQAETFAVQILNDNPDILVISNELGYGVVPMEKSDRLWREAVGRICTSLASKADEVVRVVCGVGIKIKDLS